ncbi:transposase [Streptomyces sp. NEAU-174]|uniref:transposase n=1 Tax=Streptomyces sp. NEAU-174 TaxID=3458254 RepID=UPI004044CDD9
MVRACRLTDAQWMRIEPLLPDRTPKRGGRWRDHREVIDAIASTFQTGTQWVHLPDSPGCAGSRPEPAGWSVQCGACAACGVCGPPDCGVPDQGRTYEGRRRGDQ